MAKIILEFEKGDSVKYVSHLDLVRMFGRALRRAGLEMSFSNGFNPHPIMNFAHPMGVGVTSSCELIEIGFESELSAGDILNRLAPHMPGGFKLKNAVASPGKSPFSGLKFAQYEIECDGKIPDTEKLLSMCEIITEKKTNSGIKETDIRPMIKSAKVKDGKIFAVLNCGDPNLKPELFVKVLEETGCGAAENVKIHRKALLNEELKPLISFEE